MNWKVILGLILANIVYITLGGLFMSLIEKPHEITEKIHIRSMLLSFLNSNPCVNATHLETLMLDVISGYDNGYLVTTNQTSYDNSIWDFHDSIYFAATIVTTIGYGHITPSTVGGQVFCIFFALLGIPLCLVLLAALGKKLNHAAENASNKFSKGSDNPHAARWIRMVLVILLGLVLFVFIPAVLFMLKESWTYSEALYYCTITLTTVGFGDYVAGTNDYIYYGWFYVISIAFWMFIGLAWGSTVISILQDIYHEKFYSSHDEIEEEKMELETMSEETKKQEAKGGADMQSPLLDDVSKGAKEKEQAAYQTFQKEDEKTAH